MRPRGALMAALLGALVGLPGSAGAQEPRFEQLIENAIREFEPPWRPAPACLTGVVVLLDAAGGGATEPLQRAVDDSNLWTAIHLFHLVRQGGGQPYLTRVDDQPVHLGDGEDLAAALRRRCDGVKPHLLVTIGGTRDDAADAAVGGPDDLAASLAQAIAAAADVHAAPGTAPRAGPPAVRLAVSDVGAGGGPGLSVLPRSRAAAICRALAAWVAAHRADLQARRARLWPTTVNADCPTPPADRHAASRIERTARSIWPEGTLPVEKGPWFAAMFRQAALSDLTAVYFEPTVERAPGGLVIRGAANAPVLLRTLCLAFEAVGLKDVASEMRLLPDRSALNAEPYGICRVTSAVTRNGPEDFAVAQSQLLYGEPVLLLDRRGPWLLVQGGDGYWGWVLEPAVECVTREAFEAYTSLDAAVLLDDVEADGTRIPRGARLPVLSDGERSRTLLGPGGRHIVVSADVLLTDDDTAQARQRARAALAMLHTPYVFGGRSPLGTDCSGLVNSVWERAGLPVARDAAQQCVSGRLTATWWHRQRIAPGDRLCFLDESGKLFHTGIALSATHFVHCAPPEVQISSLRRGDRLYDEDWEKTFFVAKRP